VLNGKTIDVHYSLIVSSPAQLMLKSGQSLHRTHFFQSAGSWLVNSFPTIKITAGLSIRVSVNHHKEAADG
jgi:hypothetical protein